MTDRYVNEKSGESHDNPLNICYLVSVVSDIRCIGKCCSSGNRDSIKKISASIQDLKSATIKTRQKHSESVQG